MKNNKRILDVLKASKLVYIDRKVFQKTLKERKELKMAKLHYNILQRHKNDNYAKRKYKWTVLVKI